MSKLNEKQLLLSVCGGGLLLSALAAGGIWWAKGLAEEEQLRIEQVRGEIKKAEAQIAKIPDVEADVITLRENVDEYVKILPEDDYISNFIRRTEDFVQNSGVRVSSINPAESGNRGKFDQYTYRISLRGTLWQFMKFINQFENYERFVRIKEFSLTSGDGKKDAVTGGEVLHDFSMVVETYVYRGGGAKNKNVNIQNYAAKRERLRERILANALSIKLRRYEYKDAQGRRDIYVDPRQSALTAGERNPLEPQENAIKKGASEIAAANELFDRTQATGLTYLERAKIEKQLKTHIETVRALIAEADEIQLITWPPFRLRWNNDVLVPLRELEQRVSVRTHEQKDDFLSEEQLNDLLAKMRRDMSEGKFDEVRDRYTSVQARLGIDPEDERFAIVERIEMVMLYVEAIDDFSSMPLDIAGIVVQGDGRSGLLVNGRVMEEGEYVTEELVLRAVRAESAEFLYRGFIVVKNW